jgi:ferrochelatase
MRRRYEAIGGRSPLLDITREVARKLEAKLAIPTRVAMRLFRPYPKEVIGALASEGVRRIVTVPLAQHSAAVYGNAVIAAAKEIDPEIEVVAAPNWGRTPALVSAFAGKILDALKQAPEPPVLLFTAHSLPLAVIRSGDPYEKEFRASAEDVAREVRARGGVFSEHAIAFQSGGQPVAEWLGPDLDTSLQELVRRGTRHVVIAPIGFLADHVEILYDLDIEAKASCEGKLVAYRSASLNSDDGLIEALAAVVNDVRS